MEIELLVFFWWRYSDITSVLLPHKIPKGEDIYLAWIANLNLQCTRMEEDNIPHLGR